MNNQPPAQAGEVIIVTHDGAFHGDDLLACAIIITLHPNAKIVRTRDKSQFEFANFAIDVGQIHDPAIGAFDHGAHMSDDSVKPPPHPENIPKASAGLVWDAYGATYISRLALQLGRSMQSQELEDLRNWYGTAAAIRDDNVVASVWEMVRKTLILPIDAWDNGFYPSTKHRVPVIHLSGLISSLNDAGRQFEEVIPFIREALEACAIGALVKVLRSRRIHDEAFLEPGGLFRCPVRPYSMAWVRRHATEAFKSPIAYYKGTGMVDYVLAKPVAAYIQKAFLEANRPGDKGRLSEKEFVNILQRTGLS